MFKKNRINSISRKSSHSGFLISFLFILTFLLILFNKTDYFIISKLKNSSLDYVNPITKIVSTPINTLVNFGARLNNFRNLENKNFKLQEEVIRLKKWQTLAIKNTRENKGLKLLLNATSNNINLIKTASVESQLVNNYINTININAGYDDKIEENFAVINEKGLVGKVVMVSKNNSKVLLINDSNSSIPVKSFSNDLMSIVKGSVDGKYLVSSFTKDNFLPRVGDLLVTSGNAGIFPKDILVGKIISVKKDRFLALPYVDFQNIDYVQIIKSN